MIHILLKDCDYKNYNNECKIKILNHQQNYYFTFMINMSAEAMTRWRAKCPIVQMNHKYYFLTNLHHKDDEYTNIISNTKNQLLR